MVSGVVAQHSVLYADNKKQVGWNREGVGAREVLRGGQQVGGKAHLVTSTIKGRGLFKLLDQGMHTQLFAAFLTHHNAHTCVNLVLAL